jgi:hypothetical protein
VLHHDRVGRPGLTAAASAWPSFGERAASRLTVWVTYRQAVAVPTPEPGGQLGERLALAQVGQHSSACRPGLSLRQAEPICLR